MTYVTTNHIQGFWSCFFFYTGLDLAFIRSHYYRKCYPQWVAWQWSHLFMLFAGSEGAVQRYGSPRHRSHPHVCGLLLWLRFGQENAAEKSRWYPHVGHCFAPVVIWSLPALRLMVFASFLQVSTAFCCRHVVRRLHHSHYDSWRAHQMSTAG